MATTDPHDHTVSTPAPRRGRSPWIWVSAALAVIAAGLLIWGLSLQSDLDSTKQDVADLQAQLDKTEQTGTGLAAVAKGLYQELVQQLGTTSQDVAVTQKQIADAKAAIAQAEKDAAAARDRVAANAATAADRAKATADQAQAMAQAAVSKATLATDCTKAYISALGRLFEGGSVRDQASAVRHQLQGITADCKSALSRL